LRRELYRPRQLFRSWYVFFFLLPWLPERYLRKNDFAALEKILTRDPARRGAFSGEDVRLYKEALARPGAATAAVNYYRAAFRHPPRPSDDARPIDAPTLLIWGARDRHLGVELTRGLERWVRDLRVVRLPGASHWVQHDAPEVVNQLLLEFLRPATNPCPPARTPLG
jgi:pimeloyl-ACP methyl ester carboxylesterase